MGEELMGKNIFPVIVAEELFEDMMVPQGQFDPEGAWEHTYKVFGIDSRTEQGGLLTIRRSLPAGNTVELDVNYEKFLESNYKQTVKAKLKCLANKLSTPLEWTFDAATTTPDGKQMEGIYMKKTGARHDGMIEIRTEGQLREISCPGPLTSNWALFDVVQRLDKEMKEPLRFSLLDEIDVVKKNHQLVYSNPVDLNVKSYSEAPDNVRDLRTVQTEAFQHIGEGISPTFYFRDVQGRVLLAVAGLQAYVLAEVAS